MLFLMGCNKVDDKQAPDANECEQWKVLRQAFNELMKGDFDAYLAFVDSTQLANNKSDMLKDALRQKYARENFSEDCRFSFSKLSLLTEDTAEVFFSIIDQDTVFTMQKMRLDNGKWKILLF